MCMNLCERMSVRVQVYMYICVCISAYVVRMQCMACEQIYSIMLIFYTGLCELCTDFRVKMKRKALSHIHDYNSLYIDNAAMVSSQSFSQRHSKLFPGQTKPVFLTWIRMKILKCIFSLNKERKRYYRFSLVFICANSTYSSLSQLVAFYCREK